MKKSIIFAALLTTVVLAGCGKKESSKEAIEKQNSKKIEQLESKVKILESSLDQNKTIETSNSKTAETTSQNVSLSQETPTSTEPVTVAESEQQTNETPQTTVSEEPVYDQALDGEGPNQFAQRHGITFEKLCELNRMDADTAIMGGQSLRVK
jgi:outer membrane murein-binding lipoprotein Lpp